MTAELIDIHTRAPITIAPVVALPARASDPRTTPERTPMADPKAQKKQEVGDFATFLASTRPKTNTELSEELNKLVAAVRDTGKPGSLTLTVTVKPVDGGTTVLAVHDVIKTKRPEHNRLGSLAYPDRNNNLTRTDPNTMPLFDTDDDIREPDVNLATGEVKEPPTS